MVTIAVRVSPPPAEDGATISPTSASFLKTVPVNGARTRVFSSVASASFACARAAFACATLTSSLVCALSRSASETTFCARSDWARLRSRSACTCCASSWATVAFAALEIVALALVVVALAALEIAPGAFAAHVISAIAARVAVVVAPFAVGAQEAA